VFGCGGLAMLFIVGAGVTAYYLLSSAMGTQIASAPAGVGQESAITYQVAEPVPHGLWLEYDVSFAGGDFRLEGPIVVRTAAGVIAQDTLTVGLEGPSTAGGSTSVRMNSRTVNINGQGTAAARVRLIDIPVQPVGTVVTAGVTIVPRNVTAVRALRLIVTR
jgi:hypothetical protein